MSKGYAVIGLGRFGYSIAVALQNQGSSVLAIDTDKKILEEIADQVDGAVCIDSTDEDAMRGLGLEKMRSVIVGIGAEYIEASILTVSLLRQLGIESIVARAVSKLHTRVLIAVGASEVVNPEVEMGERIARQLMFPAVLERFQLTEDLTVAEVDLPQQYAGKNLAEADIRSREGISIVAIKREGHIQVSPDGDATLEAGDTVIVIGRKNQVDLFSKKV